MVYNLVLIPDAENDLEEIIKWYDEENIDLSSQFLFALEEAFQFIILNPLHFKIVHKKFHCVNTRRFPYKVIYGITQNKRNPRVWKKRILKN